MVIINSKSTKNWLTFTISKECIEYFISLIKAKNPLLKDASPNIIYADMVNGGDGLYSLVTNHQSLVNKKHDIFIDPYEINKSDLKEVKVNSLSISLSIEQGEKVCRLISDKFMVKDVDVSLIKKAIKSNIELVYAVATNQIDDNFYLNPLLIGIANDLNKGAFATPLTNNALMALLSFGLCKKRNTVFIDHASLEDLAKSIVFRFNDQLHESQMMEIKQALWLLINDNSFKRLAYLYKSYLISSPMFSVSPTGHSGLASKGVAILSSEIDYVVGAFKEGQPDAYLKIPRTFEYFGGAHISLDQDKIDAAINKISYDGKLGFDLADKVRQNPKQYFDVICENLPATTFKADRMTRVLIQTDAF